MLLVILTGAVVVSITVSIHAAGTSLWLAFLRRHPKAHRTDESPGLLLLIKTALVLIALHSLEVLVWAVTFFLVQPDELATLGEALYFSFTTFTTLGYGDVVISGHWRLLTGIESLNGVLLVGWSTALSFAVIQRIWKNDVMND